jgi:hypothetical protein
LCFEGDVVLGVDEKGGQAGGTVARTRDRVTAIGLIISLVGIGEDVLSFDATRCERGFPCLEAALARVQVGFALIGQRLSRRRGSLTLGGGVVAAVSILVGVLVARRHREVRPPQNSRTFERTTIRDRRTVGRTHGGRDLSGQGGAYDLPHGVGERHRQRATHDQAGDGRTSSRATERSARGTGCGEGEQDDDNGRRDARSDR